MQFTTNRKNEQFILLVCQPTFKFELFFGHFVKI